MRKKKLHREPTKNYFPLPNVIYQLGLSAGAIAVYGYLFYIENRETYQCHASYATIGNAVGMSRNTVRKYVQKLERRGVIRGYKAVIDDERRGLAVNAYIAVTPIDYSQEAEIPDKLKNIDGIMSCDSVAGSPSFMLTVRVESPSKLEELLNLIHRTVSVSTETTIVLQRYFAK